MAFHDIRLPSDIERGAVGGPMFKTTVLELSSGFEKRNIDWSQTRGEWDVGYGLLNKFEQAAGDLDINELTAFFYTQEGRAHSFRFKDWADFAIGNFSDPVNDHQDIGLGDDARVDFQAFKRYISGATTYDRTITKLLSNLVVLLDNVVQIITTDYTVNLNTGVITFVTAPASTGGTGPGGEEVVAIATEFDNHVRFDTDQLQINMEIFNVGSWPNIPIVELRGTGV